MKASLMNYGVNVDALYNFVNSGDMNFGAFLGFGLGANTWGGNAVNYVKTMVADIQATMDTSGLGQNVGKVKSTAFDVHLNVGVRGVFAKAHGVELAVKIPFMETQLWKYSYGGLGEKVTLKPNYNVALRYTFSF